MSPSVYLTMRITENIELIEYTKRQEILNSLTHAAGAVFAAAGLILCLNKVRGEGMRAVLSACVYCSAFFAVYASSALYHGLPPGEAKRLFRLFDHIAIPLLLAGTATPCALITLYRVSPFHGYAVFATGWFCAAFGIITKLFFFNDKKLKTICMAVYFAGGASMLFSAIPRLGSINKTGFLLLCLGCLAYTAGAVFCRIGIKRPWFHTAFHVFVLAGSIIHFYVIYTYIF